MGLMVLFPVSEEETDRIDIHTNKENQKKITLKSYGLPMIFWGYLLAIFTVIFVMALAIKGPIVSLYETKDSINQMISIAALVTLISIPSVCLAFFFYEKQIVKSGRELAIIHKVFWIPFVTKKFILKENDSFLVGHFMDSPNVAKMQAKPELRGFENKGYFELFLINEEGRKIFLDRHSRKIDLEKIKELLSKY